MQFPLLTEPSRSAAEWLVFCLVCETAKWSEAIQRTPDESLESIDGNDLVRESVVGNDFNSKAD